MHLAMPHPQASAREWTHQDHPVATPLSGFFAGLLFLIVVPGTFAAILNVLFPRHLVQDLFPALALALIVPVVLLAREHTRRFGAYFCLGFFGGALAVGGGVAVMLAVVMAFN